MAVKMPFRLLLLVFLGLAEVKADAGGSGMAGAGRAMFDMLRMPSIIASRAVSYVRSMSGPTNGKCKAGFMSSYDQLCDGATKNKLPVNSIADPLGIYEGLYECHNYDEAGKNGWHYVAISKGSEAGTLVWSNKAGVSWTLTQTAVPGEFDVGKECPYYREGHKKAQFESVDGVVVHVVGAWDEHYTKESEGELI